MPWDFWLIFAVLLIVVPWRGRVRLRHLLGKQRVDSRERITLYATTIVFQWILAIVVASRAIARGLSPAELGLAETDWGKVLFPSIVGAAILGGLHWLNLRRVREAGGAAAATLQSLASRILPRSPLEMLPYFALAVTAGLCEEFLYRGFGMAALSHAGLSSGLAVFFTSLLFGLAHIYQGRNGVIATSLLGIVLGGFRVLLGSLVPLAIWHVTVDLVAAVAGQGFFSERRRE